MGSYLTGDVVRRAVELCDEANVRWKGAYSGRAMYGRTCVAVHLAGPTHLVELGAAIAVVIAQDADSTTVAGNAALSGELECRFDGDGHGIVAYWPRLAYDSESGDLLDELDDNG
jgi:hypothetical protein